MALEEALDNNVAEIMDAEDPFSYSIHLVLPENQKEWYIPQFTWSILYIQNVFNYEENDIFWCTADIGWITGHSIFLWPLLNGATVILKGSLLS
jgi:acetyl-CoA synthetase